MIRLHCGIKWLCVIALAWATLVNGAGAKEVSLIELSDGTVYEHVNIKADNQYKVLSIKQGDWKRTVSFADVFRILDAEGVNITVDIVGDRPRSRDSRDDSRRQSTGQETSRGESRQDQSTFDGRNRPFGLAIRGGINYSFPIGVYYDGFKNGVGYGGDLIVTLSRELALRWTTSRSGTSLDVTGFDTKVWRYFLSIQYYKWPRWRTGSKSMYYFYSGMGAVSHTFTYPLLLDPETLMMYSIPDYNETKFAMTSGGGLVAMVNEKIGIELGAAFDLIFVGTVSDGNRTELQRAILFDFKVGLVALF